MATRQSPSLEPGYFEVTGVLLHPKKSGKWIETGETGNSE